MDNTYRDEIMDHYKYPRNEGTLNNPDVEVTEGNASCGDCIKLQLQLDSAQRIKAVKYLCQGCAIAKAASSVLTEAIKGKNLSQLDKLTLDDLYNLMGGPVSSARSACAGLGLKAMHKALQTYKKSLKEPKTMKKTQPQKLTATLLKKMTLGEIAQNYPHLATIIMTEYGMHCIGCLAANYETLEEGASAHGFSQEKLEEMVKQLLKIHASTSLK